MICFFYNVSFGDMHFGNKSFGVYLFGAGYLRTSFLHFGDCTFIHLSFWEQKSIKVKDQICCRRSFTQTI